MQQFIYDPNEAWSQLARVDDLREERAGEIFWFSIDLNGAPLEVTDTEGNLGWSGQCGSFGELRHQIDGLTRLAKDTALALCGTVFHSETGPHYNMFRYYASRIAHFTVQDLIGLAGSINLYQYAPDTLLWVDPLGLTATDEYGKMPVVAGYQKYHNIPQPMAHHPAIVNSIYVINTSRNTTHLPSYKTLLKLNQDESLPRKA